MAAITGIGVVSPHGDDPQQMFDALMRGESAVQAVFPDLARPAAAATAAFDVARWFTKLQLPGVDRVSQLAVAAASMALDDAGLAAPTDPTRVGVYAGCGMGGAAALEAAYASGLKGGRVPPLTVPAFMPNAPAAHVAMRHGVQGPVLTYSVACASSAVALAEATKALQHGDVDIAIAGGSEALIVPGVISAWQALQTLATFEPGDAARCCRPFAAARNGFVLGVGAAFMVQRRRLRCDPSDQARRRGPAARAARSPVVGRPVTARGRLLQCARHGHADRRCGRDRGAARRLGRCDRPPARQLDQGLARSPARRGRGPGGGDHGAGRAARRAAAEHAL